MITPTSTPGAQVEPTEQLDELGIVQFDAFLIVRRREPLERAPLEALEPGITRRPFCWRYRIFGRFNTLMSRKQVGDSIILHDVSWE